MEAAAVAALHGHHAAVAWSRCGWPARSWLRTRGRSAAATSADKGSPSRYGCRSRTGRRPRRWRTTHVRRRGSPRRRAVPAPARGTASRSRSSRRDCSRSVTSCSVPSTRLRPASSRPLAARRCTISAPVHRQQRSSTSTCTGSPEHSSASSCSVWVAVAGSAGTSSSSKRCQRRASGRAAAEQAIDLVGIAAQPGGRVQLPGADAGQFVGFFHPCQRLVATQLGQVLGSAIDGDQQARIVTVVTDRVGAQFHLPQRAIAQLQLRAQDAQLSGASRIASSLACSAGPGRVGQGVDGLFQQLIALPAESGAGGWAGVEDRQCVQVIDEIGPGLPRTSAAGAAPRPRWRAWVCSTCSASGAAAGTAGPRWPARRTSPSGLCHRAACCGSAPAPAPRCRWRSSRPAPSPVAQHHPSPVTAQRLRHPRVGNRGVAGRFCGHGREGKGAGHLTPQRAVTTHSSAAGAVNHCVPR